VTRTALATPDGPDDRDALPIKTLKFAAGKCLTCHKGSAGEHPVWSSYKIESVLVVETCISSSNLNRVVGVEGVKPTTSARHRIAISKKAWHARVSPQKLTGLAVFIAGRERAVVGCEWRSHLAGETGAGLSVDRQVYEAAGFVMAAVHYRLQDAADLAWRPVDAVLGSRALSSCFVLVATLGFSLWFGRKVGVYGLAASLESVAVVFFASLGAIHGGRRWRDVKLPEHKPRRAKELRRRPLTS
jgi:hypothetical protein